MSGQNRPQTRFIRSRMDSFRQSISEVPIREVQQGSNITPEDEVGPDGGWGWVVLVSAFFCLCILDGIAYTFGVFLDPLVVEMSEKRSKVSIAGSLLVASYAFTGPLASRLVSRFGTRKVCVLGGFLSAVGLAVASAMNSLLGLIATYSIITGFGFGLMYIPSIVAVANHFTKKRSLAIGICLCGAGVGTFLLAPLESYLTEAYGRRATFLCMSGLCLVAMLGGLVMRPVKFVNPVQTEVTRREEEGPRGLKEKIITLLIDRDLYRSPEFGLFVVVALADMFATFGLFIPYHHLPPIAVHAGLSKSQAAFIISAIGISSTVGRLIAGWFCDRPWLHPVTICAVSIFLLVPVLLVFCFIRSYPIFIFLGICFGLFTGAWISAMSPCFVRILGLSLLSPAFGLLTGLRGITALLGPPLAANAVEYFDDSRVALYCSSSLMFISGVLFTVCTLWNRGRQIRHGYTHI